MRESTLLCSQFCEDVDIILKNYWKGFYSKALWECERILRDHSGKLKDWQVGFVETVKIYLKEWNVYTAYFNFSQYLKNKNISDNKWEEFYKNLLGTWFCCQERMNFDLLIVAKELAQQSITLLKKIEKKKEQKKELSELLDKFTFFPKPWSIYWFRALTRQYLGLKHEAMFDFKRVHEELKQNSQRYSSTDKHGKEERKISITQYCKKYATSASRYYNDLGIFLFEMGDIKTAKEVFEMSTGILEENGTEGIDSTNPYILTNYGYILYSLKEENKAIAPLIKAYELAEKECKSNKGSYISGRIYYFLGVFAYRWIYRKICPYDKSKEKIMAQKIHNLPKCYKDFFEDKDKVKKLFNKASRFYLEIKDIVRAVPSIVLLCDPLLTNGINEPIERASRRLLWDFSYITHDFMAMQLRYFRTIDQYLIGEENLEND